MSEHKIERWLNWAERLISLIKPKFHNAITRTVVAFGLTLTIESQLNILEPFLVASFELIFGPSEFLRSHFSGNVSPWLGVSLVVIGLIYNAIVNVGFDLILAYKQVLPKFPIFEFSILNSENSDIRGDYHFRGKICKQTVSQIPDCKIYSDFTQKKLNIGSGLHRNSNMLRLGSIFDPKINKDFYRERATLLKTWGGAETLSLKINNVGNILAKNVRVVLEASKSKGLEIVRGNSFTPKIPTQETEYNTALYSGFDLSVPRANDINCNNSGDNYEFEWIVGNLQAKENRISDSKIFIRSENDIEIKVKIFSDEISEPVIKVISFKKQLETLEFGNNILKMEDKEFFQLIDNAIMDGYFSRLYNEIIEKDNDSSQKYLP